MIDFITGMLVGMGAAVVIQIAIPHLKGKSFKFKKKKKVDNNATVKEPKLTEETKLDKLSKRYKEEEDMAYINAMVDFCKGE